MMHSAYGNGNTEKCIHVMSWLLYFCMHASWRPIHMHVQILTVVYIWSKTSGGSKISQRGGGARRPIEHSSRKLHKIEKKMAREEGACLPNASLDPPIKTSVADLSICMWSLTLISRLRWAVYLDVLNKQCRWWCNVIWTVFIQGQRRYVVYVPLIHRYTHRLHTRTRYPSENTITDPKCR